MTITVPSPEVVDFRLADHRCVWCGNPLPDDCPDDLFDSWDHQNAWHAAVNDRPLPPTVPVEGPHPFGPAMPPGTAPDNPADEPWWRPTSNGPPDPAHRLRRLLGAVPPGMFSALTGMLPDEQIQQLDDDYPHRPGMIAANPRRTSWNYPEPQLGTRAVYTCLWALEEIEPEPLPRIPWPTTAVDAMTETRFVIADERCPVPPVRTCPRCGQDALPVVVQGSWAHVAAATYPDGPVAEIDLVDGPRMACSACHQHYPGPDLIPMVRPVRYGWELAVVGGDTNWRCRITGEAAHYARPGVGPAVWRDLWWQVTRQLNPWPCALPDCPHPAEQWFLLGARMAWHTWLWDCADNEPLRLGVCRSHSLDLHRGLLADPRRQVNVGIHTGDQRTMGRLAVA